MALAPHDATRRGQCNVRADVLADSPCPRRQPRRDRRPRDARLPRARHRDGRRLLRRRPRSRCTCARRRAVAIGPAPAPQSYLRDRQDPRRLQADAAPTRSTPATASCRRTRTSPTRARPPASSSSARPPTRCAMGGKTAARKTVIAAGVPVVPGDNGPEGDGFPTAEAALAAAKKIGFPVMLKAAAGGGGKGMRLVGGEDELRGGVRGRAARGEERVRRRHGLPREGDRAAAPHRDPGVRRHARQRRPPLRARLLDPAPPPEGDRGGAVAGRRRRAARAAWARSRSRPRARWATSAPAPASSCSAPTAASTSSR